MAAPSLPRCQHAPEYFITMLEYLGVPVSHEKTIPPSTAVEFLGLTMSPATLAFSVLEEKRLKTMSQISEFISKKSQRLHSIQKLVGKLTFLCTTFLAGRCLLPSLHAQLRGVLSADLWCIRQINNAVRNDYGTHSWKILQVKHSASQSQARPLTYFWKLMPPVLMAMELSVVMENGSVADATATGGLNRTSPSWSPIQTF